MEKKILIADDEKDWIQMLSMRLEHEGYKTEAAFDAMQALMQGMREKPDPMLLDIMMPAGGGLEALKNIRASDKTFSMPVIVITAKGDAGTRMAAEKLGVSGYFVKPVDMPMLLEKIKEILAKE